MSERSVIHWRARRDLETSERSQPTPGDEFPEDAHLAPDAVSRRTMLSLLGASVSLAGLAGCRRPVEKIVPYVTAPENSLPGIPLQFATTAPFGIGAHGVVVESHDGRPTKIEGNPAHPASRGATSAQVQAGILDLYDPDRSQQVLENGEPSDWDRFAAFWQEQAAKLEAAGGRGLAILTESFASPTLARLHGELFARFPAARFVAYEPLSEENRLVASGTTRQKLRPVYHLDRAKVILALDADLLQTDPESVRHSRGFADGRRIRYVSDPMNRLWVAESSFSLTGANADHRLRIKSSEVAGFVRALAAALTAKGLPLGVRDAGGHDFDSTFLGALADDLLEHRGESVIVAGVGQPAVVHEAVRLLNETLGNLDGGTVHYQELREAAVPDRAAFRALVAAADRGEIDTLVVLGGNPVYDAPGDSGFTESLSKIETTIRFGAHVDETSKHAKWHLPRCHYLESWGDARAFDGTASVIQPLIRPLYGGKSDVGLLGLLNTTTEGATESDYELVRATWRGMVGEAGFDASWNRLLHDGLLERSASTPARPSAVRAGIFDDLGSAGGGAGVELVFRASPAVHDGRFANNGWLQELPDSITKLTWDNAALVSPATARQEGLEDEELVELKLGDRTLTLPVWIVPGQADGTVVLDLGYGREMAGRVGSGRGFDVYPLRPDRSPASSTAPR